MSLGLNIQEISQSRWVSVSKIQNISQSRHPTYMPVSMSLSLNIHKISMSLVEAFSQEKPNKKNLTQLDKINQKQFIYSDLK